MSTGPIRVGRYVLRQSIGSGGMASVHLARMRGPLGFARTVAVKRLHRQLAEDPAFASMLVEEARVASRIHHPNVVTTLDVVVEGGELLLVMEYVSGEALSGLLQAASRRKQPVPLGVGVAIASAMLQGLHAAHEAVDEEGLPLQLIHRDVSPQNVLVDTDGHVRIADFGIAKARGRLSVTRPGELRGKLGYIAPEQIDARPVDRRADIYAAGVVVWELLTGRRLHQGDSEGEVLLKILKGDMLPPSVHNPLIGRAVEEVVLRALARAPEDRFATAIAMAEALERATPVASQREVATWVRDLAGERIAERAALVAAMEREPSGEQDVAAAHTPAPAVATPSRGPGGPTGPAARAASGVPPAVDDMPTAPHPRRVPSTRRRWPWITAGALAIAGAAWALAGGGVGRSTARGEGTVQPAYPADGDASSSATTPTQTPPAPQDNPSPSAATTGTAVPTAAPAATPAPPSSARGAPAGPRPRGKPASSAGHPLYTRH